MTGSFDAGLNLVYWGTGNASADFYDADRVVAGTDKARDVNLYTASVVALDADTGKLRWHYQEVPDDNWDYDSAYEVILMDREIRGRMRNILVHMNKSGLTFVLDRTSGYIEWHCALCGDNGLIHGWEDTPWDRQHDMSVVPTIPSPTTPH